MNDGIERRQARKMERWADLESFDGRETVAEKIVEEHFYENGTLKSRCTTERTNTRKGRSKRQSTHEIGSEEGWAKEASPTERKSVGGARRWPIEIEEEEERSLGSKIAAGAWNLGKKAFNEVMWGKS